MTRCIVETVLEKQEKIVMMVLMMDFMDALAVALQELSQILHALEEALQLLITVLKI